MVLFFLKMVCNVVWNEWITYMVETLYKHFYLFNCKQIYINRCIAFKLIIMNFKESSALFDKGRTPFSFCLQSILEFDNKWLHEPSCLGPLGPHVLSESENFQFSLLFFMLFCFFSPLEKTFIAPKQIFFFLGLNNFMHKS